MGVSYWLTLATLFSDRSRAMLVERNHMRNVITRTFHLLTESNSVLRGDRMKIYVASSWRNEVQPEVVATLRKLGHDVYDFKNPMPTGGGFTWSNVDEDWQNWNVNSYLQALCHPAAEAGFTSDYEAMQWADAFVLVMPSGRSSHLEAGWAIGQGKPTCILLASEQEPELMYKLATRIAVDMNQLREWLNSLTQV